VLCLAAFGFFDSESTKVSSELQALNVV
jgi:hypothetical protein